MPATMGSSHEHGSREGMVLSRRWKRGSGYGIIDSMGNWHTVHGGTFNCPHCGAFYEVTLTRQPSRDRDYVPCECCGNTLAEWDSSSVPTFRLIQGPNADPTLSRCGQAGQRMRAVIPSFDLIWDWDHGGQIPC
jgi:hypothetical protein